MISQEIITHIERRFSRLNRWTSAFPGQDAFVVKATMEAMTRFIEGVAAGKLNRTDAARWLREHNEHSNK